MAKNVWFPAQEYDTSENGKATFDWLLVTSTYSLISQGEFEVGLL